MRQIPSLWTGRDDGKGTERIHQMMKLGDPNQVSASKSQELALLGFACDEGVRRNHGRVGAAQGPTHIRKQMANMSWSPQMRSCVDFGDLSCEDGNLEKSQTQLASLVRLFLSNGYRPLILGGGHETAWGHYQGLLSHCEKILIVNFDAHFDLRPLPETKKGNSGTPFTQIADLCRKEKRDFSYLCFGIQDMANTQTLFKNAKEEKVAFVSAEHMHTKGLSSCEKLLKKHLRTCEGVYLSICMDVFAQAYAPGVSAPQALGLSPWHVLPLMKSILDSGKLLSMDVVELCPPYDRDEQTAKLAASLVWNMMV